MSNLDNLYDGLTRRPFPQAVAADLDKLGVGEFLDEKSKKTLKQLASQGRYYSSMSNTYRAHPGLDSAFVSASVALRTVTDQAGLSEIKDVDSNDPQALENWLTEAKTVLGLENAAYREGTKPKRKTVTYGYYSYPGTIPGKRGSKGGHVDMREKLNAASRKEKLPGVSVRAYRRAVRTVLHLEARNSVFKLERARELAVAYGKSRLAYTINRDDFKESLLTAAFVAYYTSRLGLRTLFTSGAQARPMDDLGEALLKAALESENCRYDVIARALTRQSILKHLSEEQKGELLGLTFNQMVSSSRLLKKLDDPNRKSMVVRRGDDSYSWNAASRAFNQARTGWLNLTKSLGLDVLTESVCPGKVSAMIAADVSYHLHGGGVHDDELISRELPAPWDVVLGEETCTADMVREAAAKHGVDPDATGWTSPYRQNGLEVAAPAPELVNGCIVTSPEIAIVFKKFGVFSGKIK